MRVSRRWLAGMAFTALGVGVAAWLYRPWVPLPFDIWDFREFLPLLRDAEGPWEQMQALARYYATHGRANVAFYASFVVQWQLFGLDSWGWQLWRFVLMAVNVALIYRLLRGLGASRWGAASGAGLFLASASVQRGWIQLMAEPQALMALVGAMLLALGYQVRPRWGWRAVGILALLLTVLLSKEVVGVLSAMVVLLALSWRADARRFGRVQLSSRNVALGLGMGGILLAVGALILALRSRPDAVGYGMSYGAGSLSLPRLIDNLTRGILPHTLSTSLTTVLLYPANIAFLLVVSLGWYRRWLTCRSDWIQWAVLFGGFLAIPLLGALAYWPWVKWDSFYGLPFLLGSAGLVAFAVSALEGERRWVARALPVVIVAYSAIVADRSVATAGAALRLNEGIARHLSDLGSEGRVVVVGPRTGPRRLPVTGQELREYAFAVGLAPRERLPAVLDGECNTIIPLLEGRGGAMTLVSYSYGCGRLVPASHSLVERYHYRDWITFGRREGVLSADFRRVEVVGEP